MRMHRLVLLLLLLAVAAALARCGGDPGEEMSPEALALATQLRTGNPAEREEAALELAKRKEPATAPVLIEALRDRELRVRTAAARALGVMRDERAVRRLLEMLKDGSFRARMEAAAALGRIGDDRAVEPLVALMFDDEDVVRLAAAEALGQLGGKSIPHLTRIFREGTKKERAAAIYALGRTRSEGAAAVVLEAARHPDFDVRLAAVAALGYLRDDRAVPVLLEVVDQPLTEAEQEAFDRQMDRELTDEEVEVIVGRLVGEPADRALPYGHHLPQIVQNQRREIEAAARQLRRLIEPEVDRAAMAALVLDRLGADVVTQLSDKEMDREVAEQVRIVRQATTPVVVDGKAQPLSVAQLQQVRQIAKAQMKREARAAWERRREKDRNSAIRRAFQRPIQEERERKAEEMRTGAIVSLGRLDSQAGAEALIALMKRGRPVGDTARRALSQVGPVAVGPMRVAIDDPQTDGRIRSTLIDMLTQRSRQSAEAVGALVKLVNSANAEARRAAARALEEIEDPSLVGPLLDVVDSQDPVVRALAVLVVGRAGDLEDDQVIAAVLNGLTDESIDVRAAAAKHAGRFGDQRAVPLLVELIEKEDAAARREEPGVSGEILTDALRALHQLGAEEVKPYARRILHKARDYPDSAVDQAILAAGRLRDREAVKLLTTVKVDWSSRHLVCEALGDIGDPKALRYLVRMADRREHMEKAAIPAIGGIPTREAVNQLVYFLKSGNEDIKRLAVKGLLRQGERAIPAMKQMLIKDSQPHRRAAAAQVLAALGDGGVKALAEAVDGASADVALSALHGLGVYGNIVGRTKAGTATAIAAATGALAHASPQVRGAACFTLGQLQATQAKPALKTLFEQEEDEKVREAAGAALTVLRQLEEKRG